MIGALIGGGLGVIGSIYGGIKAAQAAKKANAELDKKAQINQAWYDRKYNEDATQTADAQRLLTRIEDRLRRRNKSLEAQQAVTGATEEALAAQREQNNEVYANVASGIAANAEAQKGAIEQQHLNTQQGISDQRANIEQQRASSIAQATSGVLSAAGGIASAFAPTNPQAAMPNRWNSLQNLK